MRELEGRVAVVTGAASGIGRALAQAFAAERMKVVLADIEEQPLAEAAGALTGSGAQALAVPTDVTRPEALEALARRSLDAFGAVHVLCNNAGVFAAGRSWEAPLEDVRWVLDVNLWGVLHGIRAFVPVMLAQDTPCHIVNTSSMAGVTSIPYVSAYHMSKHAVVALSECLYKELRSQQARIGVSVLCPELVATRIAQSERNRPAPLDRDPERSSDPIAEMVGKAIAAGTESGLDPARIAERTLRAIREDRFYVLAEDRWRELCETRLEDIRAARNPSLETP